MTRILPTRTALIRRRLDKARLLGALRVLLVAWLVAALLVLGVYMIAKQFIWTFVYYYVMIIGIGMPLWFFRERVRDFLQNMRTRQWVRFLALGYGMVLLEEVFAALFNHLTEGFSPLVYFERVGQFWALNMFAFTGLIVGTWLLYTLVRYSPFEMFCLTGLTGLYSEHVVNSLPANPVEFLVAAPMVFFVYGIILAPAVMSVTSPGKRIWWAPARWLCFLVVWYLFSLPPVIVLALLRHQLPMLFPPCNLIPC